MKNGKSTRDGRARILEQALRCFSDNGVSATTLARLREESGVSVGSFYHHFAGKEHVFAALYVESLRMYHEAFSASLNAHETARGGIEGIVAFHVAWCMEHQDRAKFLFTERPPGSDEPGGPEVADLTRTFFREVIAWWKPHARDGLLRRVDPTMCYVLWLGPSQEWCRLWFSGKVPRPSPEEIATLGEGAWRSLRGPKGKD